MSERKLEGAGQTVPLAAPTASARARPTLIAAGAQVELSAESLAGTMGVGLPLRRPQSLLPSGPEDRYRVVRELGRGGMGRVEVVFDHALGRSVARKHVLPGGLADLLVAEAQICAQLEHPSIVPVYDLDADHAGQARYTMRVVRGRTLRDVLDDGERRMGLTALLGVLRQVCLAVDYAHQRGVVHRDLKPDNIVLGEFGEVYVLDWGVAVLTPGSDIVLPAGERPNLFMAGSPGYMAPEQVLGQPITARTDVFALGVMLYEMLVGQRPFDDRDMPSLFERATQRSARPPSQAADRGRVPSAFDDLCRACLRRDPAQRPGSARVIADAIDAFLDQERARAEREAEADRHAAEGEEARVAYDALTGRAGVRRDEAEAMLADLAPWEDIERKQPAWDALTEASALSAEAARALARAEASFARALGRVGDHRAARRGLAAIYFGQFERASHDGDDRAAAHHLDLARAYDDGELALELADEGEITVDAEPSGLVVEIARYERRGLRLVAGAPKRLGETPTRPQCLAAGSYLVVARHPNGGGEAMRYPVVVERAREHRLLLRPPMIDAIPEDMVLVAGGPSLCLPPRARRFGRIVLPDFAIARYPVTLRQYVRFLDDLEPEERTRRAPAHGLEKALLVRRRGPADWEITDECVEGAARARIPKGRELDLPVFDVTWFDAVAYVEWLAARTGLPYRLPTDLEWDKAMRGADGRLYPMGDHLDASFAKLRESRPEAAQPEPVGAFPLDESPYGVRDCAGGVGDWTGTWVDGDDDARPLDGEEGAAAEHQAYWRGGNWGSTRGAAALRSMMRLGARSTGVGFRVALSLDPERSSALAMAPMRRA